MRRREFTIRSDTAELATVREAVREFVQSSLDELELSRTVLAVDEALANIIEHGYAEQEGKIGIECRETKTSFSFILTDSAPAFDPHSLPAPDMEAYFTENRSGGLGTDVFRRLARTTYRRCGDRNILTLTIRKHI
jgi:anti-sigma regulatory factor (Ser/Thr protein kinase)